jgi:hypothetical protein
MSGGRWLYRIVFAAVVVVGLGAVAIGTAGVYTIFFGDPPDPAADRELLGEFSCESFDADPAVAHGSAYGVDRTIVSGDEIDALEATARSDGYRIRVTVSGGFLGVSASTADGTEIPIEQTDGTVVIDHDTDRPFRLWIDTVSQDAVVTRTQLDICPPT